MDIYGRIVSSIIKEQQNIIGPMAIKEAHKVAGITISDLDNIVITGNHKEVITQLIDQYAKLFGKASIEICKEAIEPFIDEINISDLPESIRS